MRRVFFIETEDGKRRLDETDFPLSVGGNSADIVLEESLADRVVAHIALSSGHAYIQPAAAIELFHNHEHIESSAWLKSGDLVQMGERVLCWDVKGDQVFIGVRDVEAGSDLQPPSVPPPLSPPGSLPGSPPGASSEVSPGDETDPDTEIIPIAKKTISPVRHRRLRYLFIGLFSVLSLVALFILFATPFAINVSPGPESFSVSGFPPPVSMGGKKLAVPGVYTVKASKEGYHDLQQEIKVLSDGFQSFDFEMQELPGRLQILVDPVVPVRVTAGGLAAEVDEENIVLLERGIQQLTIETNRYLAETLEVDISGFGAQQELNLQLRPAWAEVQLESSPPGATVTVDDEPVGVTPMLAEVLQGQRRVELSLAGFKTARMATEFVAGTSLTPEVFELEPNDGKLALTSRPEGAMVSVNGRYYGSTPLEMVLASGIPLKLRLSRPGYEVNEKTLEISPDEERQLSVEMKPEYGVVFASSKPADASLTVNGKPSGSGTQRLRLTTRQHELTFSKPGYLPQTVRVTPSVETSQNVDIVLKTESQAQADARPARLVTAGGQELLLLEPNGSFKMGASRREAGRRANESQRLVEITRPYYLSINEVSNAEYRLFDPKHNSGSAEGMSLNNVNHPVVKVSWDDAARYCNWLSVKDKLVPAYVEIDGRMQSVAEPVNGYRLPSEAEWVYAARVAGRSDTARYPWGDGYPPKTKAGNFADAQIADTLANVVTGYNDGYRASAPVGSFSTQSAGFNDLGGNVAEWINDYYAVYPGQAGKLVKDPTGPASGDHHVVRDSSWRDGSITELRLSYRDYSRGPRDDLGFRIARYADE